MKKKLIEVALPLEKINSESAREKSIRFGHPSTLHLWWARRPLATARAVIWSSLVDDPSSHPDQFPTEEKQNNERLRLFSILEKLVSWDNSNNQEVLDEAKQEILKSTDGNPPMLLDPFAGGGTIPIEAQRLGLVANAHDLNPVSVLINKTMIEIPSYFNNNSPVNPDSRWLGKKGWTGAKGLAVDVQYYGEWLKKQAYNKIGYLYPKVRIPESLGGGESTVIAWIWIRTVKCPNPACGCDMPLARDLYLSKKKGDIVWLEPTFKDRKTSFIIKRNGKPVIDSTVGRTGAICACCGASATLSYIRNQGKDGKIGSILSAIVTENKGKRIYVAPDEIHRLAADVELPNEYPNADLPHNPRDFKTPNYGIDTYASLFTNRQLVAMTTFSRLIMDAQKVIENDAISTGMSNDHIPLTKGGTGAQAYSEAVVTYLSFGLSRMANSNNSMCRWTVNKTQVIPVFARQAIPMVWNYAENNVFNNAAGDISVALKNVAKAIDRFPEKCEKGSAIQHDAQTDSGLRDVIISTDPPYYDNIGYADLSDFFYIWLRSNLKNIYPNLFKTMLVPKNEELIATPYRHDGSSSKAKLFFEEGMFLACKQMYKCSNNEYPITIYYAYKQSDSDEESAGQVSTGWETMLTAIIKAGFSITGTWPMRTEMANRSIASGSNALASSIILVCRKREEDAPQTTRRNLINILRRELRPALKQLQESNIAPVDLAQSAIGPGMAVFSRYRQVLDADGTPMSVRSALQIINEEIDLYFNEQVSDLDGLSRFCVDLFTQNAFNDIKFGDADILARAKGTSVAALSSHGVVYAKAGIVHLIERTDISELIDEDENCIWMLTQQLTQAMATGGVEACAKAVKTILGSNAERAKDLAYRLYTIAEQKKWSTEAFAYNSLVVAWPDIQSRAAMMQRETPVQMDMFSMGLLDN